MKITILGPAHPFRGGIAALNERLAQQLFAEGHHVNIISFTVQYPSILFPGKTQFSDQQIQFSFPITRKLNSVNPLSWLKVGNTIKKERPDLLIVRFWIPFMGMSLGTVCRLAGKNGHTKIIAIADNIIPHEKRPGDHLLCNYFIKSIDGFITMSESVLNDLEKFHYKKPRLLTPHPIYDHYGKVEPREIALQKLNLSAEYRYVLFFGFIRDYKGLDLLLQSFANPFFKKNKIRLIVAGEFYTDSAKYTEMISRLNIEDQVILRTDYISNSSVPDYFNGADIIAQPYKSATQSGVTQIGYHFNKPMLVTNVGGLPEIVPHNKVGYVVEPEPKEIALALIDFFENKKLEVFTNNTKTEKERFSWNEMTSTLFKLSEMIPEKAK